MVLLGEYSGAPSGRVGKMEPTYQAIIEEYPKLNHVQCISHLGTLSTGNYFIEVCLDENENVWFLLHSGSTRVSAFALCFPVGPGCSGVSLL
jgi:RNA-splicing ligase RtcB